MAGTHAQPGLVVTVRRFALTAIVVALMAPAGAAAAATVPGTKIPIPASALPQGTTSTGTTPTATTPASGAQPGTVAPGSTTPTGSTPTATAPAASTPGASTPQSATGPTGATGPATVAPSTTTPGAPATLGVLRTKPHQTNKGLSGLALALAIVGALLILACLIWILARWMGLQPRWATATMYSLREASYHASATWAEFSDWARLGR